LHAAFELLARQRIVGAAGHGLPGDDARRIARLVRAQRGEAFIARAAAENTASIAANWAA